MSEKCLATKYYLEVYEDSFINDPSYYLDSTTPFSNISVGDYFNHRAYDAWVDRPETGREKFVITEIEHIFWSIEDSHNSHKLMVVVKKVPYDWDK